MVADDVTLGEVARRLDALHVDVRALREVVVEHDDLEVVAKSWQLLLQGHEANATLVHSQLETRIASIESWITWATRIVLGLVLAAVVGLVLLDPGTLP